MTDCTARRAALDEAKAMRAEREAAKDKAIAAALRRGTPHREIRRALRVNQERILAVIGGER